MSSAGSQDVPDHLHEIGDEGVWVLSSAKPGNGVEQLRDNNPETFWQSDGPQPHYITVLFHRRAEISEICICTTYKSDESYTPAQLSIRIGTGFHDLQEIQVVELKEPDGWVRIPLCTYSEPSLNLKRPACLSLRDRSFGGAVDFVRTYAIQIGIMSNHQNGRDTHLRQVRIYSPRRQFEPLPICPDLEPLLHTEKTLAMQMFRTVR
jgi:anaphase-promoting complex subunit 10